MNFKTTSMILFLMCLQCWDEASGEQCDDFTFDPDAQYCMTNGDFKLPMCRIGHCLKNNKCVPKIENNCDKDCSEGKILNVIACSCIGAKSGPNCDGVLPTHSCANCTDQQVCVENTNPPCWGEIAICDLVKCQHGGTCSGTTFDDYTCTCAPGYFGKHCEYKKFIC